METLSLKTVCQRYVAWARQPLDIRIGPNGTIASL
jgi:hypothetical protein